MRNKDWAVIHPKTPDIDAVNTTKFWKEGKKNTLPVFKGGRTIVNFHIPNPVFEKYINWRISQDEKTEDDDMSSFNSYERQHSSINILVRWNFTIIILILQSLLV